MSKISKTRTIAGILFMCIEDVAARLKMSNSAVLKEIRAGRLLAKKIGGCWYVTELWLDAYLSTPDTKIDVTKLSKVLTDDQIRQIIQQRTKRSRVG